ncbi:MAG: hypothetical protein JSS86_16175 [Cyanobacteria bacterium SZAS LIN-2]|nr:hypothetical protein [Cyanobacteria bacterium SZAS LIN-3]MBS1997862.1 hypothetical protein [Cyanobacteria bacterium SZAS LIN-2]
MNDIAPGTATTFTNDSGPDSREAKLLARMAQTITTRTPRLSPAARLLPPSQRLLEVARKCAVEYRENMPTLTIE